jgi:thiosulfate/3-mercaptopyruvate sulfurtransferase
MRGSQAGRVVGVVLAVMLLIVATSSRAQYGGPESSPASAYSIPQTALMQADVLSRILQAKNVEKPLILQVGSRLFFVEAHIQGAFFAGPGSQATGLQLLQLKVAGLKRDKQIVIYCGCCPWNRCPNLGPAYKLLHDLGFSNVKALYLPNNFGDDWVNKGYAIEQGQ